METLYMVAGVAKGDFLNVHARASASSPVVARLPNGYEGVQIIGRAGDERHHPVGPGPVRRPHGLGVQGVPQARVNSGGKFSVHLAAGYPSLQNDRVFHTVRVWDTRTTGINTGLHRRRVEVDPGRDQAHHRQGRPGAILHGQGGRRLAEQLSCWTNRASATASRRRRVAHLPAP